MSSRDATANHHPMASSAPSPQQQHPAVTPSGDADTQSATAPASSPRPTSYPQPSTVAVADAEDAENTDPAGSNPSTTSTCTSTSTPTTTDPINLSQQKQAGSLPPLPAPEQAATTTIEVNGARVSLADQLGPAVVNADGTMSRIANWGEMSEVERRNTVRVLGKRNKLRLEALREGLPKENGEGGA